ncbi:MAG: thiamine-phosphate kinase [Pseudomonadota bacterium]
MAERSIIEQIARRQGASDRLVKGIGDDCAVVAGADGMVDLWTMDSLVESVHFDLSWHPPQLLGRKAVSVNVSDIAAMGGIPRFALFSLGLPAACPEAVVDGLLDGVLGALADYDVVLAGGDTVFSPERIMMTITVCGEMAGKDVCYRASALPGDEVWVGGHLGDAACGLELCRRGMHRDSRYAALVSAHCDPVPQVGMGRLLAGSGLVHAMMDLSDGLATDLAHICKASNVGAEIEADQVPLSELLVKAAESIRIAPLDFALSGGEDYKLVFTAPAAKKKTLEELCLHHGYPVFRLGKIVAGDRVVLLQGAERRDITFGGYEHRF